MWLNLSKCLTHVLATHSCTQLQHQQQQRRRRLLIHVCPVICEGRVVTLVRIQRCTQSC